MLKPARNNHQNGNKWTGYLYQTATNIIQMDYRISHYHQLLQFYKIVHKKI